jgi:hypothetical protein
MGSAQKPGLPPPCKAKNEAPLARNLGALQLQDRRDVHPHFQQKPTENKISFR